MVQVDYDNASDLRFKLSGVDTVISTVSGTAQLNLIDAAAAMHVRRFAPSEFEGTPAVRPANDVLDNRRRAALARLQHYEATGMKYTVFTCGIFYERFGPGGMRQSQIGVRSHISGEGDYIMDLRRAKAQLPFYNEAGQPVYVCMTSARDVARMVVAALNISSWPREFRMRGDRMTVSELVTIGEQLRGISNPDYCMSFSIWLISYTIQVALSNDLATQGSHCKMFSSMHERPEILRGKCVSSISSSPLRGATISPIPTSTQWSVSHHNAFVTGYPLPGAPQHSASLLVRHQRGVRTNGRLSLYDTEITR